MTSNDPRCGVFAAPDREMVIRIVERQVELTREPGADVVDPDPDPIPRGVRDLDPLAFFASQDEHCSDPQGSTVSGVHMSSERRSGNSGLSGSAGLRRVPGGLTKSSSCAVRFFQWIESLSIPEGLLVKVLDPRLGTAEDRSGLRIESDLRDRSAGRSTHAAWGAWPSNVRRSHERRPAPRTTAHRSARRTRPKRSTSRPRCRTSRRALGSPFQPEKLQIAQRVTELTQDAPPGVGRKLDSFR